MSRLITKNLFTPFGAVLLSKADMDRMEDLHALAFVSEEYRQHLSYFSLNRCF